MLHTKTWGKPFMLNIQDTLLFILLIVFLMNFQTIVSGFVLYFWKLRDLVVRSISVDEINDSVKEIVRPQEEFLYSKGFVYKSSQVYDNVWERFNEELHTYYFYNEELDVHAFIDTTPYPGALSGSIISFTTFYESYKRATTFDCFAYNIFPSDESYVFDHYYGSYEEALESHLHDRVIEGEVISKGALSEEGAKDYQQYIINENFDEMIKRNILKKVSGGYRYLFTSAYMQYIYEGLKKYKEVKKIYASKGVKVREQQSPKEHQLYKTSEEHSLLAMLTHKPNEKSREGKIRTFLISGALFVLLFGFIGIPWTSMPIIVAVLLIHELGHYFAMKYFGYKDTSIFFIPLFGAAAKGEKEHTKPFEEYIILLAGPLPGMIISLVIGFFMLKDPTLATNTYLQEFAIMSFVLNFINLLPIYPLDGGRIVHTLVFSRYPKVQFYFFLLSLLVIIIAMLMLKSILLGLFAVALFMGINHNYNLSLLLSDLQKVQSDVSVKEKIAHYLTSNERFKKLTIDKKLLLAKEALKLLNTEVSSKLLMFSGMAFYLFLLISPFIVLFLTAPR